MSARSESLRSVVGCVSTDSGMEVTRESAGASTWSCSMDRASGRVSRTASRADITSSWYGSSTVIRTSGPRERGSSTMS